MARYTAPGAAGTYILTVTDADENLTEATAIVTDAIPLSVSPAIITVTVGTTVTLVASGGNGTYAFVPLSGGGTLIQLTGLDANKATYRSLSPETAQIEVDSGLTESVSAFITSTTPTGRLEISPSSVSLTTGEKLTFTAFGGTAPYSYSAETSTGSIDPDTGLFTAADVKKLGGRVRVTDSVGGTSDATVDVYYPLTIVPTDVYVMTGGTYTFTASGGIDTYHYFVTSGIDTGTIDELSGVYTAPGSDCFSRVKVRDDLGNTSYATVHVFVSTWYIQSVDTELKSGQYASLALDADRDPHVAYYDSQNKELRLASFTGSAWSSQVVDGTTAFVGQFASLALDPTTGHPRISYYDGDPRNRDLRYASFDGASWSWEVVDDTGTVGQYTSLALEATTGHPRISYYDATNRDLKYAAWNGAAWEVSVVDEAGYVGTYSSLALDPRRDGRASHITTPPTRS